MTIETDLRAAVSRADADSRLLHDIVHGDADSTVTTEGGTVKTVAKAIDDVEASVAAAASTVNGGGNMYRRGGAKMYHGLGGSLSA